ncbi:MAG: hypothetical protein HYY18_13205 [Planctomycetes bacterium]|nr:hypothetical protein [Planctomycetota bacterium]
MKTLTYLALVGVVVSGCHSSSEEKTSAKEKKATRRAPKVATLYVESKGEPVNAGGKKVEKSDEAGNSKGSFAAKDLLMPGMYLLVSGVTAVGGALLIKAVDRKDRPEGPTYIAGGGSEGTYVPVETPPTGGAVPAEAPDPGKFAATGTDGGEGATTVAGAGAGVVATTGSVVLSMGYSTSFTGPSYIKVKSLGEGVPYGVYGHTVHIYEWDLSLDRSVVESGTTVNVFASFSDLPPDRIVMVRLQIPEGVEFIVDHAPLLSTIPPEGLGTAWYYYSYKATTMEGEPAGYVVTLAMQAPTSPTPVKLGHMTVSSPVEITGESTAVVTIH